MLSEIIIKANHLKLDSELSVGFIIYFLSKLIKRYDNEIKSSMYICKDRKLSQFDKRLFKI